MPAEPTLDVAALTAPVPGDDPAGVPTPFPVRSQLDDARKEDDPSSFAADDPMRPTEFKKADWGLIARVASDALRTQSKDLLLAARLTEAAVKRNGFVGLRDGLRLLRAMVTECWDRLVPKVDDPSDLDIRSAPFEWLDDADHGARFPATVRQVPLVVGDTGAFGWQDWKRAQDSKDRARYEAFEKAAQQTPPEKCRETLELLDACAEEVAGLAKELADKLESLAPSLSGIRAAVTDSRALLAQVASRKGPAAAAGGDTTAAAAGDAPAAGGAGPDAAAAGGAVASPRGATRDDVYRILADAARRLEELEPHSPIPYLVRRAVELGSMPFHEMIKSFVRDDNILTEMNRELGIKPPADAPE